MIIDFHVHAFADKIAEKAIGQLAKTSQIDPFTDGTVSDLIKKMNDTGVDKAVVLPIATKPSQQIVINNWAKDILSDRLYSFGSIHPDAEDALEELSRIKNLGLYGVKLHPDYQNFFVDEKRMYPIYEKCCELNLPIVFHAGFDPISPDVIHSTPELYAKIIDDFPDLIIILAHFGGMFKWDDVEKYIAGKDGNIYLDISAVSQFIKPEQAKRIILKHGADRILFATDTPWDSPPQIMNLLKNLSLSDEDMEKILFKNAEKLLKIN